MLLKVNNSFWMLKRNQKNLKKNFKLKLESKKRNKKLKKFKNAENRGLKKQPKNNLKKKLKNFKNKLINSLDLKNRLKSIVDQIQLALNSAKTKCAYNGSKGGANEVFSQWEVCHITSALSRIDINSIVFIECYLLYL